MEIHREACAGTQAVLQKSTGVARTPQTAPHQQASFKVNRPLRMDTTQSSRNMVRYKIAGWVPLVLGAIIAFSGLYVARTWLNVKLEAAALGTETQFAFGSATTGRSLCQNPDDHNLCLNSFEAAGSPQSILWLGNSQLSAINRIKEGDRAAPVLLHDVLAQRGEFLVSYAQPNANLYEHALAFGVLLRIYKPRLLILPVFLDDIREQGIREDIAKFTELPAYKEFERESELIPLIRQVLRPAGPQRDMARRDEDETLQQRFETAFTQILSEHWPLWKSREMLSGILASILHACRNRLLGIDAQTKRSVNAAVYNEKMIILDALLAEANKHGIDVILYVPPFRTDIPGPYIDTEYSTLKLDMELMAVKHGVHFANLESIVPGPEWGTVVDPVLGWSQYDFMHFTGRGHIRHADALNKLLISAGY
jgi:hypothetical protein